MSESRCPDLQYETIEAAHFPRLSSIGKERELIEGKEVCREDDFGPGELEVLSLKSPLKEAPWQP